MRNKLDVIYDHYKDSFVNSAKDRKKRDLFLVAIIVVLLLMLFQIYSPSDYGNLIAQLITKKLGFTNNIDIRFLNSAVWFILFALVLRYFQTVIHVDRQYDYLYALEDNLNKTFKTKLFTREGKFYLSTYSFFSDWASIVYTKIFPLLLFIIVSAKIYNEFMSFYHTVLFYFNYSIYWFIITTIILFIYSFRTKK